MSSAWYSGDDRRRGSDAKPSIASLAQPRTPIRDARFETSMSGASNHKAEEALSNNRYTPRIHATTGRNSPQWLAMPLAPGTAGHSVVFVAGPQQHSNQHDIGDLVDHHRPTQYTPPSKLNARGLRTLRYVRYRSWSGFYTRQCPVAAESHADLFKESTTFSTLPVHVTSCARLSRQGGYATKEDARRAEFDSLGHPYCFEDSAPSRRTLFRGLARAVRL